MKPVNQFLVILVENCKLLPLAISASIKKRAIKIEVNNEVKIPINNVMAKPLIIPSPKIYKIVPVKMCVTLASIIERIAPFHPKAVTTAFSNDKPALNSSFALS